MLGLWTFPADDRTRRDPLEATHADLVVTSLREAVEGVLSALLPKESVEPNADGALKAVASGER